MVTFSIAPLLAVLVSAAGALLIAWTGQRRANLREFWSVAAGVAMFGVVVSMLPDVLAGRTPGCVLFRILPGVELAFRADAFGLLFALGASLLWILTSFYSIGYMRSLKEHAQTRYFACFALALSATMGVAFAANLFTLFLFYEMLTLVTYPLVVTRRLPRPEQAPANMSSTFSAQPKCFWLQESSLSITWQEPWSFAAAEYCRQRGSATSPRSFS